MVTWEKTERSPGLIKIPWYYFKTQDIYSVMVIIKAVSKVKAALRGHKNSRMEDIPMMTSKLQTVPGFVV